MAEQPPIYKDPLNNLTESILQYLRMRTDYAILISGDWGRGKTYFVKNNLIGKIKSYHPYEGFVPFKPMVISLFGVSSVNDLAEKVLLGSLSLLDSKAVKITKAFSNVILKGAGELAQVGDLNQYSSGIKQLLTSPEEFDRLVIIFDDLERKGNISWKELGGFVNELIEGGDNKIIFIANEGEIEKLQEKEDGYSFVKEKIIKATFIFEPDFKKSVSQIVDDKYKEPNYKDYLKFLKRNSDLITYRFQGQAKYYNLRTISFALEIFGYMFYDITENSKEVSEAKLKDLFLFVMVISIEFREGKLTAHNRQGIDVADSFTKVLASKFVIGETDQSETKKDFVLEFFQKYYLNLRYFFYESAYDFITGKSAFDLSKLEDELIANYGNEEHVQEWKDYNSITSPDIYNLSDTRFEELFHRVLENIKSGFYPYANILATTNWVEHMASIVGFDKKDLENDFKQGVDLGYANHNPSEYLFKRMHEVDNYSEFGKKILSYVEDKNSQKTIDAQEDYAIQLEQYAAHNFEKLVQEIQEEKNTFNPVFSKVQVNEIISGIEHIVYEGKNGLLRSFNAAINSRYSEYSINHLLEERNFVEQLKIGLLNIITDQKKLSITLLRKFTRDLDAITDHFNRNNS